jgi:rhodanese-related sulfurtransferase
MAGGRGLPANVRLESPTAADLIADDKILLVDIRTAEEWRQTGIVEGALLVTYKDAESFVQAIGAHLEPDQTLALICRSGNRTSRAARQISGMVENPVMDVAGGMLRIVREGYTPVPSSSGMSCLTC